MAELAGAAYTYFMNNINVWDDEFRTSCCGAQTTYSYADAGDEALLCCRGCYAEVVYDDGGCLIGAVR